MSIWSALFIAAITGFSVFAQDVQPTVAHPAATFQTNEDQKANEDESGIFQSLQQRRYLFGDWKGERSTLEEKGITFDFYYMDDALANPYGGREDAGLWGRIRGSADVDFSKLTSWQGLTFHMTGLWQYGTDLSTQYTGTLVNSSSLPSAHTQRLDSYLSSAISPSSQNGHQAWPDCRL